MEKRLLNAAFLVILVLAIAFVFGSNPIFVGKVFEKNSEVHFRLLTTTPIKIVSPGEDVIIISNILKFGDTRRVDAQLEIQVTDSDSNSIEKTLETFAIETQVNLLRKIHILDGTSPGKYKVTARLFYQDEEMAVSSTMFEVREELPEGNVPVFVFLSIIATLVLLVISLIIFILHMKKSH